MLLPLQCSASSIYRFSVVATGFRKKAISKVSLGSSNASGSCSSKEHHNQQYPDRED
ncbi:hypothetical protein CsSME_00040441 [Camellia sinensis var. sinensis]